MKQATTIDFTSDNLTKDQRRMKRAGVAYETDCPHENIDTDTTEHGELYRKCEDCGTWFERIDTGVHTATPWELRDSEIVSANEWLIAPNADEGEQGVPLTVINLTGAMGGKHGDAAFIVKAVNSHDALVATLREVGAFLEQLTTTGALDALACEWSHPDKVNRICDQVTAALNAVEQGEA